MVAGLRVVAPVRLGREPFVVEAARASLMSSTSFMSCMVSRRLAVGNVFDEQVAAGLVGGQGVRVVRGERHDLGDRATRLSTSM